MAAPTMIVMPDRQALALEAAKRFTAAARSAVGARGIFRVALSGGQTPQALFTLLAAPPFRDQVPWEHVHLFWGDERFVPADHPDSNYGMTKRALIDHVPISADHVHRVPTELGDAKAVAAAYEATLRQAFGLADGEWPHWDLVLLGLGEDGHTASLFPHTDALLDHKHLFVANDVPAFAAPRLTLTFPAIVHGAQIAFLVAGEAKAAIVVDVLEGPRDEQALPAQGVQPRNGELLWLLDAAAAARLKAHR